MKALIIYTFIICWLDQSYHPRIQMSAVDEHAPSLIRW